MARIRTRRTVALLLAAPLAAGLLLVGAGAAAADNGALADNGGNSSVVSNTGTGNVFGSVDGNHISHQQTATGAGASNQANTVAVKDNAGSVLAGQANQNYNILFAPVLG
ncbi:hypothetical protein ACFCX4_23685 [Kitasatospora sp. NPDC056327]|uniref:hypothetical protein n=1 Tax=Kitasatospora sp. NPDC056327 TaxID=3345785 RepID=UPI0035E0E7F3